MGLYKYSVVSEEGQKVAKAQRHDINCSYKDLSQVFRSIRGKRFGDAVAVLENAVEMKKAIPYRRFAKHIGHRSELGGKKGRYPKKECKIALELMENAKSNAVHKGMDESALYVMHAAAYKQNVLKRYKNYFASSRTLGYGKQSIWSNYVTCWAEILLGEREEKEKSAKQEKTQAKPKAAKPAAPKPEAKAEGKSKEKGV